MLNKIIEILIMQGVIENPQTSLIYKRMLVPKLTAQRILSPMEKILVKNCKTVIIALQLVHTKTKRKSPISAYGTVV